MFLAPLFLRYNLANVDMRQQEPQEAKRKNAKVEVRMQKEEGLVVAESGADMKCQGYGEKDGETRPRNLLSTTIRSRIRGRGY